MLKYFDYNKYKNSIYHLIKEIPLNTSGRIMRSNYYLRYFENYLRNNTKPYNSHASTIGGVLYDFVNTNNNTFKGLDASLYKPYGLTNENETWFPLEKGRHVAPTDLYFEDFYPNMNYKSNRELVHLDVDNKIRTFKPKESIDNIKEELPFYLIHYRYQLENNMTNIGDFHLDDMFFDADTVKIYKVDNPTIEKGYPTTEPGFLYIFNRYKINRLTKFYLHSGGRLVDEPKTWFHSEKYYYIPSEPKLAHNNIQEGVGQYNIDYSLTYLGNNDIFYDRYKHNISSALDLQANSSLIDRKSLFTESGEGDNYSVSLDGVRVSKSSRRFTDDIDIRKDDIDAPSRLNFKYEQTEEVDQDIFIGDENHRYGVNGFNTYDNNTYNFHKYMTKEHLMDNSSIVIEDTDCVVQMFVTPKRTYIRTSHNKETIYRHTALRNNEYLNPFEGILRDLPAPRAISMNDIYGNYETESTIQGDTVSSAPYTMPYYESDYNNNGLANFLTKEKYENAIKKGAVHNPNLVPNHVHFIGENGKYNIPRPLFRNSYPSSDTHIDIPSNLFVPEGLIYTEFGFYRDDSTSNEVLSNSLDEYNDLFKLKPGNTLKLAERELIFPIHPSLMNRGYDFYNNSGKNTWRFTPDMVDYDINTSYFYGREVSVKDWGQRVINSQSNFGYRLINYTGEKYTKIYGVQTAFDKTSVSIMDELNPSKVLLASTVVGEAAPSATPGGGFARDQFSNPRYTVPVLKGSKLFYTNNDIIKNKDTYLNLPRLPRVLEPRKSFILEGNDIGKYLSIAFKGLPNSEVLDSFNNPTTIVGVEFNYKNIDNFNDFYDMNDLLNETGENKNNYAFVSFMEKMKRGYPYSTENSRKLSKTHNMKWSKWTSQYYPDSDRHLPDNTTWRHDTDYSFIGKTMTKLLPSPESVKNKWAGTFNGYFFNTDTVDVNNGYGGYPYDYLGNITYNNNVTSDYSMDLTPSWTSFDTHGIENNLVLKDMDFVVGNLADVGIIVNTGDNYNYRSVVPMYYGSHMYNNNDGDVYKSYFPARRFLYNIISGNGKQDYHTYGDYKIPMVIFGRIKHSVTDSPDKYAIKDTNMQYKIAYNIYGPEENLRELYPTLDKVRPNNSIPQSPGIVENRRIMITIATYFTDIAKANIVNKITHPPIVSYPSNGLELYTPYGTITFNKEGYNYNIKLNSTFDGTTNEYDFYTRIESIYFSN